MSPSRRALRHHFEELGALPDALLAFFKRGLTGTEPLRLISPSYNAPWGKTRFGGAPW